MTSPGKNDPRFPTGPFTFDPDITPEKRLRSIAAIRATPAALRAAVTGLTDTQTGTPYREGGWTVRQVVHHVPESHMNAFIRMKLGLTEEHPTVKPYDEAAWAKLGDAQGPIGASLALMDSLHERWVRLLKSLEEKDFQRTYFHPENGDQSLAVVTVNYGWHSRHHVAHITSLRKRMGW